MDARALLAVLIPLVACSDLPAPASPPCGAALAEFTCAIRSSESPLVLVNVRDRRGLIGREWSAALPAYTFRRIHWRQAEELPQQSGVHREPKLDFRLEITTDWQARPVPSYSGTDLQNARDHLARFDRRTIRAELRSRDLDGPIRAFQRDGDPERAALSHALIERGFYPYVNSVGADESSYTILVTDSLCEYVEAMARIKEELRGVDFHAESPEGVRR